MLEALHGFLASKRTARDIFIHDRKLGNIDLTGLRADGLGFDNVYMSHVNFAQVQWRQCSIYNSSLSEVSFAQATLRLCVWNNVRAQGCDFSFMSFENSEASGCLFDDANFENASLVDSDLSRASLRNANLTNADVTGINLRGADLRGANCDGVSFIDADLRGADLSGAKLDQAELKNADVRGAIFDAEVEAAEEVGEFAPMFSPENQALADAVGPLVAGLLKTGVDKELFSAETEAKFMQELGEIVRLQEDTDSPQRVQSDEIISSLLNQAGNVGISELLRALREGNEQPSEAVAKMLKGLSKDLHLDEGATTEELLEKIVKSFR